VLKKGNDRASAGGKGKQGCDNLKDEQSGPRRGIRDYSRGEAIKKLKGLRKDHTGGGGGGGGGTRGDVSLMGRKKSCHNPHGGRSSWVTNYGTDRAEGKKKKSVFRKKKTCIQRDSYQKGGGVSDTMDDVLN